MPRQDRGSTFVSLVRLGTSEIFGNPEPLPRPLLLPFSGYGTMGLSSEGNITMKKTIVALSLFSVAAFAETWSGTVVDVSCHGKDLASHTKKCAISCSKSGYGLVTADGKFVKFDEAGNAKALEALKTTSKEADLKATVAGSLDGDTIKVESISISE